MKNSKFKIQNFLSVIGILAMLCGANFAQETPPTPGAPKTVAIPAVKENKLPNGLTVAVVERKNVPLVTVQLLVRSGARNEEMSQAGLANLTVSLLTKGTKTRSATQIAEQMEFLGGSINTGAGWSNSVVTVNVMSDKLDQAMTILSDVVMNPAFKQEEIDLLKSQTLDNLNYNLQQPGFLANYVASKYSFGEHPAGGTPKSISAITRDDIVNFRQNSYTADNAVLIFAGDITAVKANALARKFFGTWKKSAGKTSGIGNGNGMTNETNNRTRRILVVDLPDSGQAAVKYLKDVNVGRVSSGNTSGVYYPAIVLNSLLGGGYSSRLNQEIRIKRGLSYGAGSGFSWRNDESNFATSTQTKNESAAEVVKLVLDEIDKLAENSIAATELNPRKLVLTGDFGRDLETTQGLAGALADLYSFGLPAGELNAYMKSVQAISDTQIRTFAKQNLLGGDVIVVGDYAKFKDDLKTRFPNMTVEVVKAAELDLNTIR
ncbi:MAG: pitrilysin family protein [Pyrinomonadaceae bacterium]